MFVPARLRFPLAVGALLLVLAIAVRSNSADYSYPFGQSPFSPSRAETSTGKFIPASAFPSAEYCAKCHAEAHRQWRESAHSNSFRAPFYKKNADLLIASKGIEFTRHCEGCHNPIALVSGALTRFSVADRGFDEDGITCMVCHSIQKVQDTGGLASYVLDTPAVVVNEDGSRRYGSATFDEILSKPDLHRKAVMQDFYRSSEFCSTCHKAALPKSLNGYKWLRAFSVYDEWQQSSWSRETPLPFYKKTETSTCQSCHMKRGPATEDYGAKKGLLASHRWVGANTAIPKFYQFDLQLAAVRGFLEDELVNIDFFSIQRSVTGERIAPLNRAAYSISPGETVIAELVLQNKKIGHSLVPEQRDFYESWLEFEAVDQDGNVVFESGKLDSRGRLDPAAHSYTNRLISKDGKLLKLHEVWESRSKTFDNTILPGRSDLVRYKFWIPTSAKGKVTLKARLLYRRFRQEYLEFVLGKPTDYPIAVLANATYGLEIGKHDAVPLSNEDYLRWNNYGIALLGQQRYWDAERAFLHVTQIKPAYSDGWVNVAIARLSTAIDMKGDSGDGVGNLTLANKDLSSYSSAARSLERALELDSQNSRAAYYLAVIERLKGNPSKALTFLDPVLREFPRFRQARQEAGYCNFLLKKYREAQAQFEALKAINPDDLTAAYYLSLIYKKTGRFEDAEREARLYSDHREDPTMVYVRQDFWRAYPEIANEIQPNHVHESRTALAERRNRTSPH